MQRKTRRELARCPQRRVLVLPPRLAPQHVFNNRCRCCVQRWRRRRAQEQRKTLSGVLHDGCCCCVRQPAQPRCTQRQVLVLRTHLAQPKVFNDRCRSNVPSWRGRDVHWHKQDELNDRCRCRVHCWRRRNVIHNGYECCVPIWRRSRSNIRHCWCDVLHRWRCSSVGHCGCARLNDWRRSKVGRCRSWYDWYDVAGAAQDHSACAGATAMSLLHATAVKV